MLVVEHARTPVTTGAYVTVPLFTLCGVPSTKMGRGVVLAPGPTVDGSERAIRFGAPRLVSGTHCCSIARGN
jgi:hypothetical protein